MTSAPPEVDPAETRATYLQAPFSMTPAPYPLNEARGAEQKKAHTHQDLTHARKAGSPF